MKTNLKYVAIPAEVHKSYEIPYARLYKANFQFHLADPWTPI